MYKIIFLLIFVLLVTTTDNAEAKKKKELIRGNQNSENPIEIPEPDFYNNAEKKCRGGCCKASVTMMRVNRFAPAVKKEKKITCPDGYVLRSLGCDDSASWCQPEDYKESVEFDYKGVSGLKEYREIGEDFLRKNPHLRSEVRKVAEKEELERIEAKELERKTEEMKDKIRSRYNLD